MPFLSIVVANYNYGRFIEDALRSVIDQCEGVAVGAHGQPLLTLANGAQVELIVCDAESTDNSVEIIKKYADKLAWWCSEKDKGQSDAFNKGFSHAHGRFLTWLNADDIILPGAIAAISKVHQKHPECEWIVGSSIWCDANLFVHKVFCAHKFSSMRLWSRSLACGGPSSFFTKRLLDAAGGFDVSMHYCMDTDLWYRFALKLGVRYRRTKKLVWVYRFHDESKMAGRVVSPDSELTKKRRKAIQREADLILERYGKAKPFSWLLNKIPVSIIDVLVAGFRQLRFSGRHINVIGKKGVVADKVLLSNSIQEYMTGLREIPVEVHAFNNWSRKEFTSTPGTYFLEKECAGDARSCAKYIRDKGITIMYAQGLRSLVYFAKIRRLCQVKPRLIVNCHSPALWDSLWKSMLFIFAASILADGLVFLVRKTQCKWKWLTALCHLKTFHIPNPVDLKRFPVCKQHAEEMSASIVIGCIGSITPRKRQDIIVDIVKALRGKGYDVKAWIVGDFCDLRYKESILKKIDNLGLNHEIKLDPRLDYDKVPNWMRSLDIYICPSNAEVMPFSILEALASGLPVVAHDIAGISEEVRTGQNGVLVDSQSVEEYVDACEEAILNRRALGLRSRQLAETEFSTGHWGSLMKRCFADV